MFIAVQDAVQDWLLTKNKTSIMLEKRKKYMFHKLFRMIFPAMAPEIIKRKYNIPDNLRLHIELTQDGWYIADSPELPGLFTQARTREELLHMINDAILTYFDVPKREADYVYNELKIGNEIVCYQAQLRTA